MHLLDNDAIYFDSFGVEHVPKEIRLSIGNKNMQTNIFRAKANNSIMCGYFRTGFVDYMIAARKNVLPYDFKNYIKKQ